MKIALAAVGFYNKNVKYNSEKIITLMKEYSGKVDLILFGETFLQGFDSLCFKYDYDKDVGLEQNSETIKKIADEAKNNKIAVSFGYVEKEGENLYSSQLTIGSDGKTVNNYRRISTGWKEDFADDHYKEGNQFFSFKYKDLTFAVALCGDLWYDENIEAMEKVHPQVVLWPVYTDFFAETWNEEDKFDYAEQVSSLETPVLYVNSVCLDEDADEECAKGGASFFYNGNIIEETPAGDESILVVQI